LVSDGASLSVTCTVAAPAGSTAVADLDANPACRARPAGPMVRLPSTCPVLDRNRTATSAQLLEVPPSQADTWYRVPPGVSPPDGNRSGTSCTRSAVPPAPPAKTAPRPDGHDPATRGKPDVPYRTTVGRPAATRQPGIVTASQPWAEVSPAVARGFTSRLPPVVATVRAAVCACRPDWWLTCADALAG
jgi:hypothetical protein